MYPQVAGFAQVRDPEYRAQERLTLQTIDL
jgi:hypothetical protein